MSYAQACGKVNVTHTTPNLTGHISTMIIILNIIRCLIYASFLLKWASTLPLKSVITY